MKDRDSDGCIASFIYTENKMLEKYLANPPLNSNARLPTYLGFPESSSEISISGDSIGTMIQVYPSIMTRTLISLLVGPFMVHRGWPWSGDNGKVEQPNFK